MLAVAVLTRPALAVVPLTALPFMLPRRTSKMRAAALIMVPTVVAVLGWSAFNFAAAGSFSLTSTSGVNLYTHVKDYVEDAPPQYATINQVNEDVRRANGGAEPAEWEVALEVARREGSTLPEVSSEMLALSVRQIVTHPLPYRS